ncbi:unnamed protein product [Cochlearia groenlandica]
MDSEIAFDNSPGYIVYKKNGAVSKDAVYSPEKNLSVRIYLPEKKSSTDNKKLLPVLVYFHGGGFIIESAFSPTYHNFLKSTVAAANCIAISVDYRRAPEFPIPIPYEDSWEALKWVSTHISRSGSDHWINENADLNRLFLAGDSAGGNIVHHLTMRAKTEKLIDPLIIKGIVLIHPYFWGKTPIDEEETRDEKTKKRIEGSWRIASPESVNGADDPWINVVGSGSESGSDLSGLGCGKVLVILAGEDAFVRRGFGYVEKLKKSGWEGEEEVEVMEVKGEGHVHHLKNPHSCNARLVLNKIAEFIN